MKLKNPAQSRTADIWTRFVGMFGGEAVARKFGDAPPAEWVGMVGQLNDYQLERGMRRLVYSGRANVPSLPEFLKLCRTIGNDEEFGETPALPPPQDDGYRGDQWDIAANTHLLAYVVRQIAEGDKRYGLEDVARLVDAKRLWSADMRDLARNGEVPVSMQREVWADYIKRAEDSRAPSR